MARPRGHRLSLRAWEDITRRERLTITEIAERADIQRATISGLVGGHARASVPMAQRIAAVLDCHVETLFPSLAGSTFAEVA